MHPCRSHRIGILYLRLSLGLSDEVTYDVLADAALVVLSVEVRAHAHADLATSVTRVLPKKYDIHGITRTYCICLLPDSLRLSMRPTKI